MPSKSSSIAKGGLFTALSVVFLYLCFIMPTNELGFLFLTSIVIVASIMSIGFKYSILVYFSTSILSFVFGLKGISIIYLLLFGLYPFIKYKIESIRKTYIEFILKFVFANLIFLLAFYLYSYLLVDINLLVKFPITFIIIGFEFCFLLYDYLLTLICKYITTRFKNL